MVYLWVLLVWFPSGHISTRAYNTQANCQNSLIAYMAAHPATYTSRGLVECVKTPLYNVAGLSFQAPTQ
jgi:hypothetical protein